MQLIPSKAITFATTVRLVFCIWFPCIAESSEVHDLNSMDVDCKEVVAVDFPDCRKELQIFIRAQLELFREKKLNIEEQMNLATKLYWNPEIEIEEDRASRELAQVVLDTILKNDHDNVEAIYLYAISSHNLTIREQLLRRIITLDNDNDLAHSLIAALFPMNDQRFLEHMYVAYRSTNDSDENKFLYAFYIMESLRLMNKAEELREFSSEVRLLFDPEQKNNKLLSDFLNERDQPMKLRNAVSLLQLSCTGLFNYFGSIELCKANLELIEEFSQRIEWNIQLARAISVSRTRLESLTSQSEGH